jgi:hypothetical protein
MLGSLQKIKKQFLTDKYGRYREPQWFFLKPETLDPGQRFQAGNPGFPHAAPEHRRNFCRSEAGRPGHVQGRYN